MPYEYLPDEKAKDVVPTKTQEKRQSDSFSLFEKILILVIAWKYFHFTGKAIAEGKKIPKDWLKMRDRILPKKIKEMLSDTPKPVKPPSYKIVDLATKEPIKVQ